MKKKAEYKNSVRSKQMIKSAYFSLLKEKQPSKITVTDIVSTADINRGTFYSHYEDINALVNTIEEEFINELYSAINDVDILDSPRSIFIKISDILCSDREFYKTVVNNGISAQFIHKLQNKFVEYMEQNEKIDVELRNSVEFKIRARFFASGVASIYIAWINDEIICTADELADRLNEIIMDDTLLFCK